MYIAERTMTFVRGLVKRYAPSGVKERLWNEEFSAGKWDFIDDTHGDCVYQYLEKYVGNGSILDLGCGPGNTANEMETGAYRTYLGVDISDVALDKARKRTQENGRAAKNRFEQGDFMSYVPPERFDVLLFRESMYHVPLGKVKTVLGRYSRYLNPGGVFIVRMGVPSAAEPQGRTKYRPRAMMRVMESEFDVVEKREHGGSGVTVIVFRPRHPHREH